MGKAQEAIADCDSAIKLDKTFVKVSSAAPQALKFTTVNNSDIMDVGILQKSNGTIRPGSP